MENSTELCENVSVTASENTNNFEIEIKSIEEENKMSEEVTANLSEINEMEVKTLNTKKTFKWTNEATKAAACMLKDIIDEYNAANSDLSSSLDENTDPWGFEKLDKQINVLKQSQELDLFPKEWCRFKLASIIRKYIDEHCKAINNNDDSCSINENTDNNNNFLSFHYLYFALCELSKNNINFEGIAEGIIEDFDNHSSEEDAMYFYGYFDYDNIDRYYDSYVKNTETATIADEIFSILRIKDDEATPSENRKKFEKALSLPYEFQVFYLVDLFKQIIFDLFPKFEDIDETKGLKPNNNKDYNLMKQLAECSYRSIDFLNIADAFITDEINNLKGLKETYSSMFEE